MVHSRRIEVAYLVIATQEDNRFLGTVYRVGQTVYHTNCMFSVAWLGQTIAVEYHKVVVDVLGKMLKVGKCLGVFVQVVEDKACKVFVIYVRCAE